VARVLVVEVEARERDARRLRLRVEGAASAFTSICWKPLLVATSAQSPMFM
jgi:hypothetical protein